MIPVMPEEMYEALRAVIKLADRLGTCGVQVADRNAILGAEGFFLFIVLKTGEKPGSPAAMLKLRKVDALLDSLKGKFGGYRIEVERSWAPKGLHAEDLN